MSNLGAGIFGKAKVGHSAISMWKEFWTSEGRLRIKEQNLFQQLWSKIVKV